MQVDKMVPILAAEMRRKKITVYGLLTRGQSLTRGSVYPFFRGSTSDIHLNTLSEILRIIGRDYTWLERQCRKASEVPVKV
jgi:hypothetical protein